MAGIREIAERRGELLHIDPRKLSIREGWNSRDITDPANIEHINELSSSIAQIGVKEPLKVVWEDDKAYVTNGHCRLMATMQAIKNGAEIKTVQVLTEDKYANEADRVFTQIASNSGKPLTTLEQATVFKKLLDLGWSQKDISEKSGKTPSRVSQILELLTMPEAVKKMVKEGEVSATLAMQTVKEKGNKATAVLSDAVKEAHAEGKDKASPKHMEGGKAAKVNLKKALQGIFENATYDEESEDKVVLIGLSDTDYQLLINLLDL